MSNDKPASQTPADKDDKWSGGDAAAEGGAPGQSSSDTSSSAKSDRDGPNRAGPNRAEPNRAEPNRDVHWERDLLNRLSFASLNEQRRARRWNVLFKMLLIVYLIGLLFLYADVEVDTGSMSVGDHTAVVDVTGVISSDAEANAEDVIEGLRDAFEDENTRAVVIRINSPGGSPVQAGLINDEIRRLKALYTETPVYAVVEDLCASGGYYIAVAADKIYADKGSIIGSIGVCMDGFGFVDSMEKLGVERRLLTSGEHKALLDPFSPEDEVAKTHMQAMLDQIHSQFINVVKQGRGDRLNGGNELFSGLVWTGDQAVEKGLIDGLGSVDYVARELVGAEEIVDYTATEDVWSRLADRVGTSIGDRLFNLSGGVGPQLR